MVWKLLNLTKKNDDFFHSVLVQNEEFSGILRWMSLSNLANMSSNRLRKWKEKPLGRNLELLFCHYLSLISIDAGIIRWLGEVFHCKVLQKTAFNKEKSSSSFFLQSKILQGRIIFYPGKITWGRMQQKCVLLTAKFVNLEWMRITYFCAFWNWQKARFFCLTLF